MGVQSNYDVRPSLSTTGVPIGAKFFLPAGATVPAGYLLCDGSSFSALEYPELNSTLGSTTLPNYSQADDKVIIKAKDVQISQTVNTQLFDGKTADEYALKTGTGASGTWNISITGNAATSTNADTLDGKHASEFAAKSTITTATLSAASWTGASAPYSYSLTVSGVTDTSNQELLPTIDATKAQLDALLLSNIQDAGQSANTITLKAWGVKPTVDLPIRVILRGDM